jgi:hypothetical protein
MFDIILMAAAFLTAVVMGQALAHVLEMPGKMRLDRDQYYTVQTIYYPGFTIGGIAEPLSIVAAGVALLTAPAGSGLFWLVAVALAALALTQLLFWLVVQPVNRQWLGSTRLSGAAEHFFRTGQAGGLSGDWTRLRDRWERGHAARAMTATIAFVLLLLAVASGQ